MTEGMSRRRSSSGRPVRRSSGCSPPPSSQAKEDAVPSVPLPVPPLELPVSRRTLVIWERKAVVIMCSLSSEASFDEDEASSESWAPVGEESSSLMVPDSSICLGGTLCSRFGSFEGCPSFIC